MILKNNVVMIIADTWHKYLNIVNDIAKHYLGTVMIRNQMEYNDVWLEKNKDN